ncbi:MAG: alpha/beta fold hydrolase [Anaerolineae bacterium]|nr:alpha/beta fold hydrolase [Anaerolineae bacterium]
MKSMRSAIILVSVLALLLPMLTACKTPSTATPTLAPTQPPPTATPAPTPPPPTATMEAVTGLEKGACPFDLPAGLVEGKTIDCGYLVVPEDRSDPNSPTIRLAVAILHPSVTPQPDPIVYLEGGPGGSALEFLFLTFGEQFEPLLAAGRDIILFDQRGVGRSEPALDCPGIRELGLELLDDEVDGRLVDSEEALDLFKGEALACRQDLAEAAELAAYNTAASAADVNELREALGYDQVNLWGASYGTWLALEVMRRYPEGIRSVVLDSVYPPQRDLLAEAPTNAARSIDLLFEACAADQACNAAFPNLSGVYLDTVERLNQERAHFKVTDPLTRKSYDMTMTGDNLATLLFRFLYGTSVIPSLPQILYDASQEDYATLAQLMGSLLAVGEVMSQGQQFSVLCHDEVPFISPEAFETSLAEHPELERAFSDTVLGELGLEVCADWQVGRADETLTQAVSSDIPTLIMAGEFDPITPPAWGRQVGETLKNSYFFEYPGVGHGASASPGCPQEMMMAFLDDPGRAPDDACVAEMEGWAFVVPSAAVEVEWAPFSNETMGIEGMAPVGWTESVMGVYSRGSSGTDVVAVLMQSMPGTALDVLDLLTEQLGLATVPESTGQREANGLSWNLYAVEVMSLQIDFALSEGEGRAYVVLLQSSAKEHDALYESVYLTAINALKPIE